MKHASLIPALVLAAAWVTATSALAMGPRGGQDVTFQELDADGDGEVSKAEMEAHRMARFDKADTDGDGKLSVDEMQAAAQERANQMVSAMFERHDADKDGFLADDELPSPRRAGKFFDRMDADGNGAISAEEFADAQERMQKRHKKRGHGQTEDN
ncbi:calcium-binding protein [Ruegeria sediminis]|uniref:Calcium-binding protein n=1 Tax=Ruegeria sediminis TaxID=2583820 RepID=A0ABY2WYR7_9RHOB|nr:EF-hand domain-containing protein [Ruegeria sediminis]TMV08008.1 calcium-binding protein [Ruegeria sediminis]